MCGIWAHVLHEGNTFTPQEVEVQKHAMKLVQSRGPDRMTEQLSADKHICFHRLSIHDLSHHGDQPFVYHFKGVTVTLMCNGEIYNWKELIDTYNIRMSSHSDCEVIGHLFQKCSYNIQKTVSLLHGEFAIVMIVEYVNKQRELYAIRDPFGVRPLYYAHSGKGIVFSSLLSGITHLDASLNGDHLPPGCILHTSNQQSTLTVYYDVRTRIQEPRLHSADMYYHYKRVTDTLIQAVKYRLDSDRKIGFLLSGGLDSSLVVAIAVKILGVKNAHTFSIGMDGSQDIMYAKRVAQHLGTKHMTVHFTPKEGCASIYSVIEALETYDITTIRASIGQYLLAKYISEMTDIKVILNGDGSDEVTCGYMYFHHAPNANAAHEDAIRLLREIHRYDGLRVDRTLSHFGLEARIPFLDPLFVEAYLSVPRAWRMPDKSVGQMEKQFLRDAFNTLYPDLLPKEVMYRTKEAFSDGVSGQVSWYEILQKWCNDMVSEQEFAIANKKEHIHPQTKEAYFYRDIFDSLHPHHETIVPHYWMPKWTQTKDPSARTLKIYQSLQVATV